MKKVEALGPYAYTITGKSEEAEDLAAAALESAIDRLSHTYRGSGFDLELADVRDSIERKYNVEIGLDL